MITKLPQDRPLPHKQEILERVLADDNLGTTTRRRRTWLVPVGAAASIALVVGGVIVTTTHDRTEPSPATHSPSPSPSILEQPKDFQQRQQTIELDVGPLSGAVRKKIVADCTASLQGVGHATGITHAVKVRNWGTQKTQNTIALTGADGLRYACSGNGTRLDTAVVGGNAAVAAANKTVITVPDATHPAAPAEGGAWYAFVDFDKKPDLLVKQGWYSVDDRVGSMRQRWVVRGKPGPWYVAKPADGLVFLLSWNQTAPLKLGEKVQLQTQVLDHRGKLLNAPGQIKGGGGMTPSPGTTRVDTGTVIQLPGNPQGDLQFS